MDYDTFRVTHPEFQTASEPLVREFLKHAAARLSATVLGASYDEAHGALVSHMIATSPGGQMARMVNKDGSTIYSRRLDEIKMACVPGVLVS